MSNPETGQIDSVMQEDRQFPPGKEFSAMSHIGSMDEYRILYDKAKDDPEGFWGDCAREELHWFEPFQQVLKQDGSDFSWFLEGKTNVSYNCLDANIEAGNGDRTHQVARELGRASYGGRDECHG